MEVLKKPNYEKKKIKKEAICEKNLEKPQKMLFFFINFSQHPVSYSTKRLASVFVPVKSSVLNFSSLRFSGDILIAERRQTDGETDRQANRISHLNVFEI